MYTAVAFAPACFMLNAYDGAKKYIILLVDDDPNTRKLVVDSLQEVGYDTIACSSAFDAITQLMHIAPSLIICTYAIQQMDGLAFLQFVRSTDRFANIPFILLAEQGHTTQIEAGFEHGADDCVTKPYDMRELHARIGAKLRRPPIAHALIPTDRETGLLSGSAFKTIFQQELNQAKQRHAGKGCHISIRLDELPALVKRYGNHIGADVAIAVSNMIVLRPHLDVLGHDESGAFQLLMLDTNAFDVARTLTALCASIESYPFVFDQTSVRLTPIIGYTMYDSSSTMAEVIEHTERACDEATSNLDLRPIAYNPRIHAKRIQPWEIVIQNRWSRLTKWCRQPLQNLFTFSISFTIPIVAYLLCDRGAYDITTVMYYFIVASMGSTALIIWIEGFAALKHIDPPVSQKPAPPATAIIAAYLPNEAAILIKTIEAFLQTTYPGPLQIILAYNTPIDLPIEDTFREIAAQHPQFVPIRVVQSSSKAQNINTAISYATGTFIGVFDADHRPEPTNFTRAWDWLDGGYDIVQGRCVVRNGANSWIARLVAVEFELMYGISHPGRERLHQFGIFGGSNGYWRTDVLRAMRMRNTMLTEDIDSSVRAIEGGYRIASDPYLISSEEAPTSLTSLWNQRMRWAQGWDQVSGRHLIKALASPRITARQKIGFIHLLGWREVYPWISMQIFPLIGYWYWRGDDLYWFTPLFVVTTVFTLSTAPGEAILAYIRATPDIRANRWWFFAFFLATLLWYAEWKNFIVRVARIKEILHETSWKITPRDTK